jgi:hypothetical protein
MGLNCRLKHRNNDAIAKKKDAIRLMDTSKKSMAHDKY